MVNRIFLLLIYIVIFAFQGFSKNPEWNSREILIRQKYNRQHAGNFSPSDLIIRELAKEVLKQPWEINWQIKARIGYEVASNPESDTLVVQLSEIQIFGDTLFRRFSITDVLTPSSVEIGFKFANLSDTTGYTSRTYSFSISEKSPVYEFRIPVPYFDRRIDTVLFQDIKYTVTEDDWARFRAKLEMIHNYHASNLIFDTLKQLESTIHLADNLVDIKDYFKIQEINHALASIRSYDFPDSLLKSSNNGDLFTNRFTDAFRAERSLTFNFLDEINNPKASCSGETDWIRFFTGRLRVWIERTQWMDKLQGTIYSDVLRRLCHGRPFPEQPDATLKMLKRCYPQANPDTLQAFFVKAVYQDILTTSERLIQENNFAVGAMLLQSARLFAREWDAEIDTLKGFRMQSMAIEGVFNSFVGIAEGCLIHGNVSMTDRFLEKAAQYRKENHGYIFNDSAYNQVFSRLFFMRNTACDQLLEKRSFGDALQCYEELSGFYNQEDLKAVSGSLNARMDRAREGLIREALANTEAALNHNDDGLAIQMDQVASDLLGQMSTVSPSLTQRMDTLAPELAAIKMERLFGEADTALEKRQFTLALGFFDQTRELASTFHLPLPQTFDSLYRRNYKHYLMINLSAAQRKIWNNEFELANRAVEETRHAMTVQGLEGDPDLDSSIVRFQRKIQEQKCRNLSDTINGQLVKANSKVKSKSYIDACRYFIASSGLLSSLPGCRIGNVTIADSLAKYQVPAKYQEILAAADAAVAIGQYEDGINNLIAAVEWYRQKELDSFLTQSVNVFQYLLDRNNPYLTLAAIDYTIVNGTEKEMVELIKLVKDQNLDVKLTLNQQKTIGRKLAQSFSGDNASFPGMNWFAASGLADQYFFTLREAFTKAFKETGKEIPD